MDAKIGVAAGDVYRFLEAEGASTVRQLKKATGHSDATINQAIGWLAREEKVSREMHGRTARWSLA
ncbi:MAG: winged helix-turn-helix domain-containing protein [Planctomycetes bacterium]|nr:winged helix-turn-helix domain-containing protein [Planctomycetota bacterium]